ncbi:MAG: AAA family ATPase [Myxococcales bacterium]|nr:AAA family ATPase [Myxococcales bacterium]MCB9717957.1 AAA family ATPase [Myxococcales bacterium]
MAVDVSEPGAVAGRYRVELLLGRGAMGEVHRAYDLATDRPVALKRFRHDGDKRDDRLRFRHEFHTLARLRHPRIVEVFDYGVDEHDRPFYAMELLDGRDLAELSPLPWRRACGLLRDVASALAFLHARQLLHRDVAPRNVRCTEDGRAKLLDFGMLATMGVSHEVVGTLPAIAPEMLLGLPMDGRADLFGLGALAFWLITGRHPQRVRSLEDLMRNGRRPPPAPSTLVPDLPPALDDLVLSLLSAEPLGRPAHAAEVIERLGAIAELPAAPELEVAHGYVRSAALVGREREMELARKRIERTVDGQGGALLVVGRSGMGKTRLLREIELEAKLAGAVVLHGEGGTASGPYALVRELARQLERRGRRRHSAQHKALIDRLLPEPGASEGERGGGRDHREDRAAVQAAFGDWLVAFAAHRALVIIVDNLQRVDEGSAAVLAGLAHIAPERSLLLVGAIRSDEPGRADGALHHLRERAVVLHTHGLREEEVLALVRNTFGEVDNHASFASWLHRSGGGSPLHCTELIRSLVDRGELRYVAGLWVIPEQIDTAGLPRELDKTLDARVATLGDSALRLGQALAVYGDEAGLALCVALAPELGEQDVFIAIDTMVREEVIIGAGERYRLRHDGLRDALLRSLDPAERRTLERHVGETLAAEGPVSPEREAQIGWHLLRGGDQERGATLLGRAGRRLFEATSFEDCVAPLEAALAVLEARGDAPRELSEISYMLVSAGFYCDREVNLRHRERALVVLGEQAGVLRARRLSRWLGATLGLVVAVLVTMLGRVLDRRRLPFVRALEMYLRSVVYSAGVSGFSFDTAGLRRCHDALVPLRPVSHVFVRTAVGLVDNLLAFNLGRLHTLMETSAANLAGMAGQRRWLSEEERALTMGGARFQRALIAARVGSPDALDEIEALETLGPRIWAIGGLQARTYYHMWRGEAAAARRSWAKAELEFVRLGALWQLYAIHHSSAAITYAYTDDMLGLRRCIEGLQRQVEAGLGFGPYLRLARAEHARLRGEHDEALALIDEALAALPEGEGLPRPWALAARADVLREAGRLEAAREAGEAALALSDDREHAQNSFRCRAERCLALVEAALGEGEAAARRLDRLVADAQVVDNPFILGAAHEARAEVAHGLGDELGARRHAAETERCFVPTRNPVLIARYERLLRTIGEGPEPDDPEVSHSDIATIVFDPETSSGTIAEALSRLSACHTAAERAERALLALRESVGATEGFLYLLAEGRPALAAPSAGSEPPPEVGEAATRRLSSTHVEVDEEATLQHATAGWVSALLHAEIDGKDAAMGAVVLGAVRPAGTLPPAALRRALGQRLYEEGDVSLG